MTIEQIGKQAFLDNLQMLQLFLREDRNFEVLGRMAEHLAELFVQGNKALICGNGGSACDAMHFAQEFTGRFRGDRPGLPVISLTDSTHITCVGNDYGFEHIFARGVEAYGQAGDLLVALSTSGNSENVIAAVKMAKAKGMATVCLLGKGGGALLGEADFEFVVPGNTSDRIQELHMIILHTWIELVERILFPENYSH